MKENMIRALAEWVIKITQKEMATNAEIAVLASVAKVVADYSSLASSPDLR